ncbi:hypothetical protein GCM10023209_07220 [Roseibacterium beibuensis]|uniref:Uncharacterized protein n=2 Tax=[Roseibacterium] beibuensis TaxID=1193142 RepID=A0ABP9KX43_9RHOB
MLTMPFPPVTAGSAAPVMGPASPNTPPPGTPTETGRQAVTPASDATPADMRQAPCGTNGVEPLDPPADPPPVKGLGIPPLDVTRVGDSDSPEARPRTPAEALFAARLDGAPKRDGA